MKTVNLLTGERVKQLLFPDNQPHITVRDVNPGDALRVVAPIRSSLELVQLLMICNAARHCGAMVEELVIPYLMGARYDRVINPGDSFDLEVVAEAINALGFARVNLFDVHSNVALALIRNAVSHNNSRLVKLYAQPDAVLIVPDHGACEKAALYQAWNPRIATVVHCEKERDKQTGRVTLRVLSPEVCADRNCVVIDDICDGGATFLCIAEQIKPAHLTLIVSHGIFSKGFRALRERYHEIITTDSFYVHPENKVTLLPLNL